MIAPTKPRKPPRPAVGRGPPQGRRDRRRRVCASVFDKPYQVGGFTESVSSRAFNKSLKEADIRALFNHDPNYPLGRGKAGTLALAADTHGLHYEIQMPTNPMAAMVTEAIERGDVTGSSFSFEVIRDSWDDTDRGPVRRLHEVKLFDVGPVTFPASEATEVDVKRAVRSLAIATSRPEKELLKLYRELRALLSRPRSRWMRIFSTYSTAHRTPRLHRAPGHLGCHRPHRRRESRSTQTKDSDIDCL